MQPIRPHRRVAIARAAAYSLAVGLCATMATMLLAAASLPPDTDAPHYDAAGRMILPANYRTWIFLSSGIDMSYSQNPAMASRHMFNNVFVPRTAYAAFMKTGHWPDGSILILENRGGAADISINKRGLVQTAEFMGLEAHVKDTTRFTGGWGFFALDGQKPADLIPFTASCYACHQAHAAVDTTFVQFYPTLLPIAAQHATFSRSYLADSSSKPGRQ